MRTAVSIDHLSVSYGEQLVLRQIDLEITAGKLVWLIGPNGSGKSTLIGACLGLIPYLGSVRILGQPVGRVYHKIGYVPQRFSFDRTIPLTVRELLALSLATCPCHNHNQESAIAGALQVVRMSDQIDRPLAALSGGQLQRILLARALVHKPQLIILDEPEAGVDRGSEATLYPLLRQMVDRDHLSVVIASHDLTAAGRWADQVIALQNAIIASGPPGVVLRLPAVKRIFHQ